MSVIPTSAEHLSKKEAWSIQQRWLEIFARTPEGVPVKVPGKYMWHLFSFGLCPHLHGAKARSAYESLQQQPYYVFSEDMADCVLVRGDRFPRLEPGIGDWYVASESFEWTFVSTHESFEFFAERQD